MGVVDPVVKLRQAEGALEYEQFCKLVSMAWNKGHPDIPLMAAGSKNFDNERTIITYHLQQREAEDHTKKPRVTEAFNTERVTVNLQGLEVVEEANIITFRQDFTNVVVFTVHVPIEKGGGEIADLVCAEFERFMIEHTPLFMRLGAKNLAYYRRFYDDNLLKELSSNSARRFIAYTLYTQIVTQSTSPILQQMEAELRVSLEGIDSVKTTDTYES